MLLLLITVAKKKPRAILENDVHVQFFTESPNMYELKIHRGIMSHDNEEWCKIWKGINFSV